MIHREGRATGGLNLFFPDKERMLKKNEKNIFPFHNITIFGPFTIVMLK
jgi:hypothetical protein